MNKNLLLVEDNPLDVVRIKEYLADTPLFQYDLMEADSLRTALSLLAHHNFDVVLLDLDLPDSSGLDTARRVITEYAETAILVLADVENDAMAQQAVRYGAEDYLEKKLLSSTLLFKSIHYAVGRKRVLQEKYDILSDLVLALEKIEQLESLLPICLGCKKILLEDNTWLSLEEYSHRAAGRKVFRPICPDCRDDMAKGNNRDFL
jgi:DNA-binding NarL/FixJ family response regulator